MLELKIVGKDETIVTLEHSLFSLSKWESIHEKPFLNEDTKTQAETQSYILCMLRGDFDPDSIISLFKDEDYERVNAYLDKKHTATWFTQNGPEKKSREVITSELLYYWMISFNIPIECQHWHLNRLLTLIRVFSAKQEKPKKQSPAEMAAKRRQLNAERQAKHGTKG